jgi:hypothetical protein
MIFISENNLSNRLIISRFLDTVGDGSGTKNAIGDYSGAVEEFKIVPGADEIFVINRLIAQIRDNGVFSASTYGAIAGGLTNGVVIRLKDSGGTKLDLCDGLPIKTNAEWARVCYDTQLLTWGAGDSFISVRWTFSRSGTQVWLDNSRGDYLSVDLNDDLTTLESQYFLVQGFNYKVNA